MRTVIAVLVAIATVITALFAGAGIGMAAMQQGMNQGATAFFAILVFVGVMILGLKGAEAIKG